MTARQRYVSRELIHFVGRELPEKDHYPLLIKILTSGWLTHPPHDPDVSGHLTVNTDARISENGMYYPQITCFSDIPIGELDIHIQKFSRFGLSFLKSFLVQHGANPVFYIARNATTRPSPAGERRENEGREDRRVADRPASPPRVTLAEHFDRTIGEYHHLFQQLRQWPQEGEIAGPIQRLFSIKDFLDYHVFSFLKFFDESKPENDPENYYMEREWRILGNLHFSLSDIRRIILPESYAARLREDLPKYVGQITFVE
ncbi:MAG: hypothetical protein EPO39_07780 [Candidatus Manganitrophaceae bacterium]|nr:MAG: hypothetical protein EPO39_07780 [Candidatus Manganitrophaceae bacterium]